MRLWAVLLTLTVVLATSGIAWASPPTRPAGLTTAQFNALQQIESQPQHAIVLDIHASYKSERERSLDLTRASDDFWTAVYQGGFPGAIAAILICAAPL